MGHSMGGGTLLTLLRQNPKIKIAGFVLSNPFISFPSEPPFKITFRDRIMIKLMPADFKMFLVSGRVHPLQIARGHKARERLFNDPKLAQVTSLTMIKTLLTIEKMLKRCSNNNVYTQPCLFLLGKKDTLTPYKFAVELVKKFQFKDVTVEKFEDGHHAMFVDEEGPEIVEKLLKWMEKKLEGAPEFGNLIRDSY